MNTQDVGKVVEILLVEDLLGNGIVHTWDQAADAQPPYRRQHSAQPSAGPALLPGNTLFHVYPPSVPTLTVMDPPIIGHARNRGKRNILRRV